MNLALPSLYLVHPISGLSGEQVFAYYDRARTLFGNDFNVLCPMTGKGHMRTEKEYRAYGYEDNPISSNHAILARDMWMVDMADMILADFTPPDPGQPMLQEKSIGCVMELSAAKANARKHRIIVAALGHPNVHEHGMLLATIDHRFFTLGEAEDYLFKLVRGEP